MIFTRGPDNIISKWPWSGRAREGKLVVKNLNINSINGYTIWFLFIHAAPNFELIMNQK